MGHRLLGIMIEYTGHPSLQVGFLPRVTSSTQDTLLSLEATFSGPRGNKNLSET